MRDHQIPLTQDLVARTLQEGATEAITTVTGKAS
jgi:hypothetical protein